MFGSITTYYVKENMIDAWLSLWTREVQPEIMQIRGLIAGHILVDRDKNLVMHFQMWENEHAALEALRSNRRVMEWEQDLVRYHVSEPTISFFQEEISYGYIGLCASAS